MNSERIALSKQPVLRLGVALVVALLSAFWLFGNNTAGYHHVLQKWPSGNLEVVSTPGLYWKGPFGKVTEFQVSDTVGFTDTYVERKKDKKKVEEAIAVIFKDNGEGAINGSVRYTLPADDENMKRIVQTARSEAVLKRMIRAHVNSVLNLVASSYESGDSVRERGRLIRDVLDSLQNGPVAFERKIVDGNVAMLPASDGETPRRLPGLNSKFGITIGEFTLKSIEYDGQTQAKLDEHRLLEQQRNNASLAAEKLKQETLTARAEEEKLLAEAKAQEEHKKLEARIRAETEKEVARIGAEKEREVAAIRFEQAQLEKRQRVEEAEGKKIAAIKEAEGRAALARADNSLELKLQMKKETLIGVANALKDIKVPTTIVGGNGSGTGNPILDVFLMRQLKDLQP
ncbi:MAG: hypothetical protein HYY13_00895 [Nitrospirae bacterium]|nr:hypothetical protein [Nitrospirota bacterium]